MNDHFAKNKDLYKIFYWKVYDLPRFFFQTEIIGSLGRKVYDQKCSRRLLSRELNDHRKIHT